MDSYEKKYKEALRRAKTLIEKLESNHIKGFIYDIFPELIESDDERIREELIGFLRNIPNSNYTCEEMALWLEKQGEQKLDGTFVNVDDVREDFVNEVYRVLDADTTNDRANQIIDAFDNLPTITIEKQGENHDDKYNITGIKSKHAEGKLGEMLKKIKSTDKVETKDYSSIDPHFGKPIDKVEPKFKQGQWIVWKDKCYKVNYNGCGYELIDQNGLSTSLEYGTIDENAHLWTIEDAKAGDLIYSRHNTESFEWIGIFKSLDKENKGVHFYGFWNNVTKTFKVCGNELFVLYDDFSPATKEQRDTLIKAMADAGYTFDFEKKELKKIEDETEIPFGAKDSELIAESYYIPKGFHAEIDGDKVVIKKGEKPTEWSEEDEEMLNLIIKRLQSHTDVYLEEYSKECGWLNSPKARSTWKPSDEQMKELSYAVSVMASSKFVRENDYCYNVLKSLRDQLKKLK